MDLIDNSRPRIVRLIVSTLLSDDSTDLPEGASPNKSKEELSPEALEKKCSELESEYKSLYDKYLRSLADQQNTVMDHQKDLKDLEKSIRMRFLRALLDPIKIIINVMSTTDEGPILRGLQMIFDGFEQSVKNLGGSLINPKTGDKIDYQDHMILHVAKDTDLPSGVVIKTFEVGMKMNDNIIEPAKVTASEDK